MEPAPVDIRRLASRRAIQLREAARMADCLRQLMRRAGAPTDEIEELAKSLRIKATEQDLKAFGRVNPRRGTKASGHPLLEGRPPNLLYLDESGSLNPKSGVTVFAVGGVAMSERDQAEYVERADQLKLQFFGHRDVTFHEPMMRKHEKEFHFNGDESKQRAFDHAFQTLLDQTPFIAFACGIRTIPYMSDFLEQNADPYLPEGVYEVAVMLLLERYTDYLAHGCPDRRIGRVHFESIGAKEDAERQLAYAELLLFGTQFVSERHFMSRLETGCRFSPKTGSSAAELADLVAREVFEWVRGECSVRPRHWDLVSKRFYRREDLMRGKFGLKVFPDHDIRDRIEAHRMRSSTVN